LPPEVTFLFCHIAFYLTTFMPPQARTLLLLFFSDSGCPIYAVKCRIVKRRRITPSAAQCCNRCGADQGESCSYHPLKSLTLPSRFIRLYLVSGPVNRGRKTGYSTPTVTLAGSLGRAGG
jgi:hypothetical protein